MDQAIAQPISVLPRAERADQGSVLHTAWCPKCRERTLPGSRGQCMWCDTPVEREVERDG